MSKTLKKLTVLMVVTLAVIGGIFGTLSATANAQSSGEEALKAEVAAASEEFVKALVTSDDEPFESLCFTTTRLAIFPLGSLSG